MQILIKYTMSFLLFFFIGLLFLETIILIYPKAIYTLTDTLILQYIIFPLISGLLLSGGYVLLLRILPKRISKSFTIISEPVNLYAVACIAGIYAPFTHLESVRFITGVFLLPFTVYQITIFIKQMKSFLSPRQYVTHKEVFIFFRFFVQLIVLFTLINFLFRIPDNPVISASEDMLNKRISFYDSHDIYNALYFTVITMTTVGFGDFIPISYFSKMILVAECLTCYVMLGIMIGLIVRGIRPQKTKRRLNRSKNHFSKPQKQK